MTEQQAFPSNYIGKEDLASPITLIIEGVDWRELNTDDGGKEKKPVVFFTDEQAKPLILNRVNWRTLADTYGQDSDAWQGKTIELYVDPNVTFGLRRVGGVRVRIPQRHSNGRTPASSPPNTPRPTKQLPPIESSDDGPPEKTTGEAHRETLEAMGKATSMKYRNDLIKWRRQWTVSKQEETELHDALHAPLIGSKPLAKDTSIPF